MATRCGIVGTAVRNRLVQAADAMAGSAVFDPKFDSCQLGLTMLLKATKAVGGAVA